ncbi:MAG: S-layer homology domain-containing protein [Clostridia bacterium]|nr:S-layer homology domain-containing protein [Clostridia bacterium]
MKKRRILRSLIIVLLAAIMLVPAETAVFAETPVWGCADLLDYASVSKKQFSLSDGGFELIKYFEGYYKYKYWDYKHWTIGYGTYCGPDDYPNGISEPEAAALLRNKMPSYEKYLDDFLYKYGIRVNQNQYDALVSLTYNLGGGIWTDSYDQFDLKDMLMNGVSKYTDRQIKDAFGVFCRAGGKVLTGLVNRRAKEAELFLSLEGLTSSIFDDVLIDAWYLEAVEYVYFNGYIVGVGNNCFNPDQNMTRAMIACVLHSIDRSEKEDYRFKWFEDVDPSSWYGCSACWMGYNGIASGIGANLFCPDNNITREDLSVLLYKFSEYKGISTRYPADILFAFTDCESVSSYARAAMSWAVENGIVSGYDTGELKPASFATRAEVAAMIRSFCEKFGF